MVRYITIAWWLFVFFFGFTGCTEEVNENKGIPVAYDSLIKQSDESFDMGNMEEGYRKLNALVQHDSTNIKLLTRRALARFQINDMKGALLDINTIIKRDNTNGNAYFLKGKWWIIKENLDSGLFYYNKAVILEPDSLIYVEARSEIYNALGRQEEAIKDVDFLIEKDSINLQAISLRAAYYYKLKNYRKAIEDCNYVIARSDKSILEHSGDLFSLRAGAYFFTGKNSLAIDEFNKAISIDSTKGSYYLGRGGAKYKLKDKKGACEDFKRAGELGNVEGRTYYDDCVRSGIIKIQM